MSYIAQLDCNKPAKFESTG